MKIPKECTFEPLLGDVLELGAADLSGFQREWGVDSV
jgi:hypothetical protein